MNLAAIYQTIQSVKAHEVQTRHLAKIFECQLSKFHRCIQLPEESPIDTLVDFVKEYVDHVPIFIEAVHDTAELAGIEDYINPFINVSIQFFTNPPQIVAHRTGLDELMDAAYLTHRLFEEVSDRYMNKAGIPLIPLDMTTSNLIIHYLIGEPFANELDNAVHSTVMQMIEKEEACDGLQFKQYAMQHKEAMSNLDWPCLSKNMGIGLDFKTEDIEFDTTVKKTNRTVQYS